MFWGVKKINIIFYTHSYYGHWVKSILYGEGSEGTFIWSN